MGKFTQIRKDAFEQIQADTGVLLKNFDPETATFQNEDIITTTSGGITINCTPTYSDWGEDIDNVPNDMKEFKHLDSWECTIETTAIDTSPEMIRLALGSADIDGSEITPRASLKQTDFTDLWWVGDKISGGLVACKILNALSTSGLSLKTGKNEKGQMSITLTGHVSINNQGVMPMKFISTDVPTENDTETVSLNKYDDTPEEY